MKDRTQLTPGSMPSAECAGYAGGSDKPELEAGESTIHVVEGYPQVRVVVTGRVTVDCSPRLRSVLLEVIRQGKAPTVVIDFAGVSYVDMSGIATLIEALKPAREHSKTLRLAGTHGQARALAGVAQLDKVFQLWGSEVDNW